MCQSSSSEPQNWESGGGEILDRSSREDTCELVLRAVSIALRNLAIDHRNKDIIGNYAIRDLVGNLPCGQQHPAKNLEGDTVVQSSRETKAAAHVLQTIWSYKDLRNNLYKAGWKKSLFKVNDTDLRHGPETRT
ncbi:hypothetical protein CRUP_016410 [Coryphaenoides rupestris]|nr:hypothetical protein CRUP_016410 [Coryphaenoides rupestris]